MKACGPRRGTTRPECRVRSRQEQLEADLSRAWGLDPVIAAQTSQTRGTQRVHEKKQRSTNSHILKREIGGAGGIRTHEWRFCRPLPWATWVPRRILKYNKPRQSLWRSWRRLTSASFYFFSAVVGIRASRRNRADSSGGVGLM